MFHTLLLRDIAEIIIYASCIFTFCTWLKTDKTKNLLLYFFAYCTIALSAWVAQLPTLTPFLFTYAPIALLLFIVLHEKTLQRNAVALCSIAPMRSTPQDWLDIMLSSCLALINSNKSITIILEHTDALDHFLSTPFTINADIGKDVLDILLTSNSYDENKMVWLDTKGTIRGINVSWIARKESTDDRLFYTLVSDALIISVHATNRTFTVAMSGKEIKNLAAHHVQTIVKKQLSDNKSSKHKGAYRENSKLEKPLSF